MNIPIIANSPIKPFSVSATGDVLFTNGTDDDLVATQSQCEAYGYKYDKSSGMCKAFNYSSTLGLSQNTENNNVQGSGNVVETGTNNTYIMGENNTVRGASRNNIIAGINNEVKNNINNAVVFGVGGAAVFDSAMIFGGNSSADRVGTRQTITLMYGGQTTTNTRIDIHPNNGDPLVLTFFQPEVNRVYYFQSETLAVRIGGSSGSGAVGDFKSWVERGVVKCNGAGTLSIERTRTSPVSSGTTTGWGPENQVSGVNFQQTVKGSGSMTVEWVSTIRFMQLYTGVTLP